MTVLVGVRCTDGVVIGADSIATSTAGQFRVMQLQSNDKIRIFGQQVICATTGSVGLAQRLHLHVHQATTGNVFKNLALNECAANISTRFLTDCDKTRMLRHPPNGLGCGALIAACIKGEPQLIEYDPVMFQPEVKEDNLFFVSMGSGQALADPFLAFVARVLWGNTRPSVERAKFGVYWALDHTIKHAPGGVGGPIRLAELREINGAWAAREIEETQETAQYITDLETHIADFALKPLATAQVEAPPVAPAPPNTGKS
ncbi:MAG: hypothetical protein JSR91_13785 [Proteobacteria bacterium]|nr:hypothetical protein [Pseudomonadota bacterium]